MEAFAISGLWDGGKPSAIIFLDLKLKSGVDTFKPKARILGLESNPGVQGWSLALEIRTRVWHRSSGQEPSRGAQDCGLARGLSQTLEFRAEVQDWRTDLECSTELQV